MSELALVVLLIEDNPGDARLIREALADAERSQAVTVKFKVTVVDQLSKGLAILAAGGVDIILLDLSLPDSQGLNTVISVVTQAPEVPVVVLTGLNDEALAVEAVRSGAQDYLVKSQVDSKLLARAIHYAIERQGAQEALAASERRFRALIENSSDAVALLSPEGRFLYTSASARKVLGYTPDELVGQNAFELIHPDDREALLAGFMVAAQKPREVQTTQLRVRHKDGSWRWIEGTAQNLLAEPGVEGIVVNYRDITVRKQAEEALQASEKRFRRYFELGLIGMAITSPSKEFIEVNDRICEILGYSQLELMQITWDTLTHPDDLAADLNNFNHLLARQIDGYSMEKRFIHKGGGIVHTSISVNSVRCADGSVDYLVALMEDITERKQAEQALREAEAKYRTLVEQIPAITYITTLDEFSRAIYISPQISALGFTPEEWITGLWVKQLHPDDRERVLAGVRRSQATTAPFSLEYRLLTRDGRVQWYHDEAVMVCDAQGQPRFLQGVRFDITEHKMAENQIQYQADLLANVSDAIVASDENGILTSWNKAAETLYGWKAEEVLGRNGLEIVQTRWAAADAEEMRQDIAEKGYWRGEVTQVRRDGTRIAVEISSMVLRDESGQITGYVSVNRDITERKQAEEKIQRQLQRLSGLHAIDIAISSSFDIRVILDIVLQQALPQLGVDAAAILLFNPHHQTIECAASQGFRSDALHHTQLKLSEGYAGRAVRERLTIHIPDLLNAGGKLAKAMQSAKEDFVDYYGTPLIVKGEIKGVLEIYHRSPLHSNPEWLDFLETLAGQAAIAIDNAQLFETIQRSNADLEQRVIERTAELNQTNIKLERANRAKDEFLANMSHELRTPLNSILGLSETLLEQRRDPLSDHQQKSLQMIESSGRHLLELINDILDLSKIEAGKLDYYPQIITVDELCRASLAFVKEQATRKSITITYQEEMAVSKIYADPRRLKQILVNLLTNAVKFTPDHGQVILRVCADAEKDRIQFSVVDNGIGIAPEDLKRLFQPFVQVNSSLNREFEGTGLGLALVQKLTDLHGGSVDVESEAGKGSRFTINLPWGEAMVAQQEIIESGSELLIGEPAGKSSIPSEEPFDRGIVLLAEDNMANILTIGEYLEGHGYQIVVAHDGLEAIEKAEEINPNIILMDIQMPAMDGLEAMRRLRVLPRFASTPIIALTALAMRGDRERCLEAGANEYMSKPASLRMLVKTISQLLSQKE